MAVACVFRLGPAALVAVQTGGLLLLDTVERAGETGSGGHGATGNAGQ